MMSGAKTSWFLSLASELSPNRLNDDSSKKDFFLRLHLVGRLATILGAFGGVELLKSFPSQFWLIVGAFAIAFSVIGTLIPSSSIPQKWEPKSFRFYDVIAQLKAPALALAVLSVAFFGIENGIRNLIYQPFILEITNGNQIYLAYFQVVLALLRLGGIMVYMALKLTLKHRYSKALLVMPLFAFGVAEIVTSQLSNFWVFVAVYGSSVFTLGWFFPLREQYLNSLIPEPSRATLISVDSMVMNLASASTLVMLHSNVTNQVSQLWIFAGSAALFSSMLLIASKKSRH
jgi:hypothetical protein